MRETSSPRRDKTAYHIAAAYHTASNRRIGMQINEPYQRNKEERQRRPIEL